MTVANDLQTSHPVHELAATFSRTGVVAPIEILSPVELSFYSSQLTCFLNRVGWSLNAVTRHKPHLYLKWANDLGRHPKIIESVREILGNDILMWYSVIFVKPALSPGVVPWHQDSTFWALEKDEGVTAWVALSDVTEENGCVSYIPGSHLLGARTHEISNLETNLLARGQMIKNLPTEGKVSIVLKAGQCSLHDPRVLHSSAANQSRLPRLGIAFRYIKADNAPKTLRWLPRTASLVSGTLKCAQFLPESIPLDDYDSLAMAAHKRSVRVAAVHTLFGDTSRSIWRKIADLMPILLTRKTLGYLRTFGVPVEQNNDS